MANFHCTALAGKFSLFLNTAYNQKSISIHKCKVDLSASITNRLPRLDSGSITGTTGINPRRLVMQSLFIVSAATVNRSAENMTLATVDVVIT